MSAARKEIQRLEKDKAKAQLSNDLKKEAEICNELGELYAQNDQYEDALREHQQELQLSESTNDVVGAAIAHRKIGECHLEMGCFSKALKHHHKHLSLAKSAESYIEQQRALATIGRTHLCQADVLEGDDRKEALEKSKSAFLEGMRVCQNHLEGTISNNEYHEMRARIFLNLGLVFDYQRDFNNSVKFIQQAAHIAQQNQLSEDLLRCHLSLADIYRNAAEYVKSLSCLEKSLHIAKRMKSKEKQAAILFTKGNIHSQSGDLLSAKRALKKAYKLGSETDADRHKIVTSLKQVIKGCKLESQVEEAVKTSNQKELMALEEQLGDLCCKMNSYNEAIQHYKRQLDCALALQETPQQLIPIYVSLAATYADNKQYSSAVEMYQKELKLRSGNPKEECLTWLNVADAQDKAGEGYEVLEISYKRAMECAEVAKIPKLQFRALKSLMLVQEHFQEESQLRITKKKMSHLKEDHSLPSDYEESSDEEEEQSNSLQTEEMNFDLSDSDDSEPDQEDYDRPQASKRAQIAKFSKTNEKGETLLHRACIEGNLKQVKSLLEKGHPVNPRDYCGWLPLHEACNHDFYDIVEVLLEHGAAINDRGGEKCGGITPLHDAISCGNLEVALLLVDKGASAIAKDDNGLSPLDTLEKWKENNMGDLDDEVIEKSQYLAQKLENAAQDSDVAPTPSVGPENSFFNSDLYDNEEDSESLSQGGTLSQYQSSIANSPTRSSRSAISEKHQRLVRGTLRTGGKGPSRRGQTIRTQTDASSSDEDESEDVDISAVKLSQSSELPTMTPHDRNHSCSIMDIDTQPANTKLNTSVVTKAGSPAVSTAKSDRHLHGNKSTSTNSCDGSARLAYRTAIDNVGSAASRLAVKKQAGPTTTRNSNRTGEKVALISENDYVADDWLIEDAPSKRRRVDVRDVFRETEPISIKRQDSTSKLARKKPKRQTQLKLTGVLPQRSRITSERGESSNDETEMEETAPSSSSTPPQMPPSQLHSNHEPPAVLSTPPPATASSMRVKVRVLDKVFLISVPLSSPKTIKWLSEETGNRYYSFSGRHPQLSLTTADNALFSPDDVVSEIINNNEEVLGTVESWHLPPLQERYRTLCQKNKHRVHPRIERRLETQDQHDLDISSLTLNERDLKPLFSVLQCQNSLRKLFLSRNRIDDEVMSPLADTLSSLPNLCLLDLSCNEISHEGLRRVSDSLSRVSAEGEAVDGSSSLRPLQCLEELVLDYNSLTDKCASCVVKIVKHCPMLSKLSLSSTGITKQFFQSNSVGLLEAFQGADHLQHLNVSHNALGSSGVELLLQCLNPERVNSLDLGAVIHERRNSKLTKHLADFYSKGNCSLHHLNLEDCKLQERDMEDLAKCIPATSSSVSWSHLGLAANPLITHKGISILLSHLQEEGCGLKSLDLATCGLESPLEGRVFDLLAGFMSPAHPSGETLAKVVLSGNNLSKLDLEVLINIWEAAHDESALHFIDKVRCILYS